MGYVLQSKYSTNTIVNVLYMRHSSATHLIIYIYRIFCCTFIYHIRGVCTVRRTYCTQNIYSHSGGM